MNRDLDKRLEELSKNYKATPKELDDAVHQAHVVYDEHVLEQRQAAAKRITQAIEVLDQGHTVREATEEEVADGIHLVIHPYGRDIDIPLQVHISYRTLNARKDPGGPIIHVNGGPDEESADTLSRFLEQQINQRL